MTTSILLPEPDLLRQPLRDLAAWTEHFRQAEIPVLADTAAALEAVRANEERADANSLGEMLSGDPLMTLKVLAYASEHRSQRVVTSVETVISALVLLGIPPFFRAFGMQPSVEERLGNVPDALSGLDRVLRRAHRGADFALAFAIHRTAPNASAIHAAALLHEFAEMLLWCHAPQLALRIQGAQEADPALRSSAAQMSVLNVSLADLQQRLVVAWQLPPLLLEAGSEAHGNNPGASTVALAARLARHTAQGWDNPALPDDIADVAAFLNLSIEAATHLVRDIDSP